MAIDSNKGNIPLFLLMTLISLAVYYYLFDLAVRRIVFIYEHMNLYADSQLTMECWWIAGILLSGFLTVFDLPVRLVLWLAFIVTHLEKKEIKLNFVD